MSDLQRDTYTDNDTTWQRLTRLFDRREKTVVAWIGGNSQDISTKQYHRFREKYTRQFEHIEVRVDQINGGSIYSHLRRLLTGQVYNHPLFHLRGIPQDNHDLIFEVNFERDLLFRKLPASIIFWGNDRSEIAFQRLAPDFWDWLVYRFHFDALLPTDRESPAYALPSIGEAWESRAVRLRERLQSLASNRDAGGRPTLDYAEVALSLGKTLDYLAHLTEARQLYDEAIGLFQKEQSDLGRANALKALGDLESRLGNVERARSLYDEAIGLFQKEQDAVGLINTCLQMARLTHNFGLQGQEQATAQTWYEHSLHYAQQTQVQQYVDFVEKAGQQLFGTTQKRLSHKDQNQE